MALTIALIAHDGKKSVMVELARQHIAFLSNCRLMATGTTGSLLQSQLGLTVERMLSGPLGETCKSAPDSRKEGCMQ